jgi:hypothetical protein
MLAAQANLPVPDFESALHGTAPAESRIFRGALNHQCLAWVDLYLV